MLIKKNLILKMLLMFTVLATFIQAQPATSTEMDTSNSESKNLYAIQFYLVNGLSVAAKKQLTDDTALRLHVDFSADITSNDRDENRTQQSMFDTSSSKYYTDENSNSQSIVASIQYLYFPYNSEHVNLYIGCGPHLGYRRTYNDRESKQDQESFSSHYIYERYGNNYSLGVLMVAGLNTHINNYLSLFAEYKISTTHTWSYSDYKNKNISQNGIVEGTSISKDESSSWSANLSRIKLGLTINF